MYAPELTRRDAVVGSQKLWRLADIGVAGLDLGQ
jgi:hypothetical protein